MSIILLALACTGEAVDPLDRGSGDGGSATNACPSGMLELAEADLELGEWDGAIIDAFPATVVQADGFLAEAFCIDAYAFPGVRGQAWPLDGLSHAQLPAVEAKLAGFGRRLCTVTELLLAASGPENWRHPYDPEERIKGRCEPDDLNPSPIGTFPLCESPLGVFDFEVRSAWARMDEPTTSQMEAAWTKGIPGGGTYASVGGTSRTDTYYAPSNFGIHFHSDEDKAYTDDGLRVCADPNGVDSDQQTAWSEEVNAFEDPGTFAAWLAP